MAVAVLTAALMLPPAPFPVDIEPPCPEGLIHTWGVLCVTQAEFDRLWGITRAPTTNPVPIAHELVGEPLARHLVEKYFPAWEVERALDVIWCESRYDPNADNPNSSAAGLWQFIRSTWNWVAGVLGLPSYDAGGPYDPDHATRAAAWLSSNGGWQHWNASRGCWG